MPPHHTNVITIRPRSLKNVLADLYQARADFELADMALMRCKPDAEDRYAEAETRLEDLRQEFDARLMEVAGLTVEDLRGAYAEALI